MARVAPADVSIFEGAAYQAQAPGGAVPPNIYDEADAVYSAANYLNASGAPGDWPGAIFAYNPSSAGARCGGVRNVGGNLGRGLGDLGLPVTRRCSAGCRA